MTWAHTHITSQMAWGQFPKSSVTGSGKRCVMLAAIMESMQSSLLL
jgi:hypothetical protein